MAEERLSKVLAGAGVASRRGSDVIIESGRVKVNGQVITSAYTRVDPEVDTVVVDGKTLPRSEKKVYYILNKPRGYICSCKKVNSTKIVLALFKGVEERLFSVGRLDKDTEGLLIMTNDGDFAQNVIHPSNGIRKEYLVKTKQEITPEHLKSIAMGTHVDGVFLKPLRVKKVRKGTLKIVVTEGKKHEVRHLVEKADLDIIELKRIRIGGLLLGELPVGTWRPMTDKDKKAIFHEKETHTKT